jgi:hypothetical protein
MSVAALRKSLETAKATQNDIADTHIDDATNTLSALQANLGNVRKSLIRAKNDNNDATSNPHLDSALANLDAAVSRKNLAGSLPSLTAMVSQGVILLSNLISGSKEKESYRIALGAFGLILLILILFLIAYFPEEDQRVKTWSGAVWVVISIVTAYLGSASVTQLTK